MGLEDEVKGNAKTDKNQEEETMDAETIDEWIFGDQDQENKGTMSLIYGEDGTAKSGVALSAVNHIDGKVLLLDMDNSASSLLKYYSEEEKERIIIRNPQVQKYDEAEDEYRIDYDATFNRIRGAIQRVKQKHEEHNIEAVVIDGLGTLKDYAEKHMRITENVDPDEGIQIRKWKIRNKMFDDIVEQAKSLPIHTIFIGHEDFIVKNKPENDVSSLVMNVNKKMHNKVHMTRNSIGNITKFEGEFDKAKYNVANEGKTFTVLEVEHPEDEDEGDVRIDWDSSELIKEIMDRGGQ